MAVAAATGMGATFPQRRSALEPAAWLGRQPAGDLAIPSVGQESRQFSWVEGAQIKAGGG